MNNGVASDGGDWRVGSQTKEAVATAKDYTADLFAPELVADLGLEEVEYDEPPFGCPRPWG
jgi:hypothetical protein